MAQYFDKDITRVSTTLGIEQEYFLVDTSLFYARPDLAITGRTVFGHSPAKGQQFGRLIISLVLFRQSKCIYERF